MFVRTQI